MYVIGDLHANVGELRKLLSLLKLSAGDTLVFLGDYIDKNVHTKETLLLLNLLKEKYHCIFIKGNHEFVWERYLNHREIFRQEFLLTYGGVRALEQYSDHPKNLIEKNDISIIKRYMEPYLEFIQKTQNYYLVDNYFATHAGLLATQLSEKSLHFSEINYFLREDKMNFEQRYLDKYIVVAGHTYWGHEPLIRNGYIGIDLGAGYEGYIGALDIARRRIIRSDGEIFNLD